MAFEKYLNLYKQEFVLEEECENIDEIKETMLHSYKFKMPIEYNDYRKLSKHVKTDMELDGSDNIINHLFPDSSNNSLLKNKWSSLYSVDKKYIKDNQVFLKKYKGIKNNIHSFMNEYIEYKSEQNFVSKYQYIQFKRFFYLNSITGFLQLLAMYNFCTPLMSLLSPIFGLIIPYFVLYFKGVKLSFIDYIKVLKKIILSNNMIGGMLNFQKRTFQQNMYTMVTIFFYCMSIYNNITSCIQFYKNTNYILSFIDKYDTFIKQGDKLIDTIYKSTKKLNKFKEFNTNMISYKDKIKKMKEQMNLIVSQKEKSLKYGQIGLILKCNYEFFYNDTYHDTIMYLIYLNQFNNNICCLRTCIKDKKINKCSFLKNEKVKPKIKNMYYLPHINNDTNIKNDILLKKNLIITGPNASGKTTLLKSSLINLFLSQSIGYGCYDSCFTTVYDLFHSYLNIPDTSGRDSLFQAEARRCKDIITIIEKNNKNKHFCIFDEIYSGTNPSDAVLCASLYLKQMNKLKDHVDYMLTTHYVELSNSFDKDKKMINKRMQVQQLKNKIKYLYKIESGISTINGGYQVLVDLNYPTKILE